jgi:endonuclease/exonuclease/phosphatase family metal-dependent hydrolase
VEENEENQHVPSSSSSMQSLDDSSKEAQMMVDTTSTILETSLTIVSINLAACEPSQSASWDWNQQRSTNAVQLEILKSNPDIIALQECPGGSQWAIRVFPAYQAMGAIYSHADQVILLVKQGISAEEVSVDMGLPAIMAELRIGKRHLLVASVHLAPFRGGSSKRKAQLEYLLQKASSLSLPLIIAGDTNMRVSEDHTMEDDLKLLDVWKLAGSNPGTKWTWDTVDHTNTGFMSNWFGEAGGYFNKYYGPSTREYSARYDRIYIATRVGDLEIKNATFELIANQSLTNKYHFLSDHFGISSTLELGWKN